MGASCLICSKKRKKIQMVDHHRMKLAVASNNAPYPML
jgi:hypothetical protein